MPLLGCLTITGWRTIKIYVIEISVFSAMECCAMQIAELQAAVGAEAESRKEVEQQLAQAAQEAADAAAAKHALSEELAAEKNKVPCLHDLIHTILHLCT